MADLSALIERVEALTGPDWDVGCEVIAALIPTDAPDARKFYGSGRNPLASLDAAIALVERVLPGMWRSIEWAGTNRPPSEWPVVEFGIGDFKDKVQAKTAPIALVLALLRAMQKEER